MWWLCLILSPDFYYIWNKGRRRLEGNWCRPNISSNVWWFLSFYIFRGSYIQINLAEATVKLIEIVTLYRKRILHAWLMFRKETVSVTSLKTLYLLSSALLLTLTFPESVFFWSNDKAPSTGTRRSRIQSETFVELRISYENRSSVLYDLTLDVYIVLCLILV